MVLYTARFVMQEWFVCAIYVSVSITALKGATVKPVYASCESLVWTPTSLNIGVPVVSVQHWCTCVAGTAVVVLHGSECILCIRYSPRAL